MKIWVDDIRTEPEGYVRCKSTNDTISLISRTLNNCLPIELIDLDHDAGDYASAGGDYVNILNWLEENNFLIPIRIHSMNPVGVQNMRNIIKRNNWVEVN